MTYLLQRLVVDKAGGIFRNLKLTLLDLLAELPVETRYCELTRQGDDGRQAARIGQHRGAEYDVVSNRTAARVRLTCCGLEPAAAAGRVSARNRAKVLTVLRRDDETAQCSSAILAQEGALSQVSVAQQ